MLSTISPLTVRFAPAVLVTPPLPVYPQHIPDATMCSGRLRLLWYTRSPTKRTAPVRRSRCVGSRTYCHAPPRRCSSLRRAVAWIDGRTLWWPAQYRGHKGTPATEENSTTCPEHNQTLSLYPLKTFPEQSVDHPNQGAGTNQVLGNHQRSWRPPECQRPPMLRWRQTLAQSSPHHSSFFLLGSCRQDLAL